LLRLGGTTRQDSDSERSNEVFEEKALHSFAPSITCKIVIESEVN
jgi:hypothetical protein